MATELIPQTEGAVTPLQLLDRAMGLGMDTAMLKELMALERQWKADQAREAFVAAMSEFRNEAIEVVKRKRVRYENNKGEMTQYDHATLHELVTVAAPALSKHGLSHRWETKQDGPLVTVTCIVTHRLGHSESAVLSAAPDKSGGKNDIQAIGSAVTYLERYTFMAITGLAAKDQDDDGHASEPPELVTTDQVTALEDRIKEIGTNKAAFLRWLKVESIDQLRAKSYDRAMKQLDAIEKGKKR